MTKIEKYRPIVADILLDRKVRGNGAVLIEYAYCRKEGVYVVPVRAIKD